MGVVQERKMCAWQGKNMLLQGKSKIITLKIKKKALEISNLKQDRRESVKNWARISGNWVFLKFIFPKFSRYARTKPSPQSQKMVCSAGQK